MPGVHLNAEGLAQAAKLAERFHPGDAAIVISSPLERCRETAAPIAERLGLPVIVSEALNEIDCGAWTGKSFPELDADPRWAAWNDEREQTAVPCGEAIREVQTRVMNLIESFGASEQGPVVLVSHSDVIKAAISTLLGVRLQWHDRIQIDPASMTTVDLWPGAGKIVRMNEVPAA